MRLAVVANPPPPTLLEWENARLDSGFNACFELPMFPVKPPVVEMELVGCDDEVAVYEEKVPVLPPGRKG